LSAKFTSLAMRALPHARCGQISHQVREIDPSAPLRDIWKLATLSAPAASGSN